MTLVTHPQTHPHRVRNAMLAAFAVVIAIALAVALLDSGTVAPDRSGTAETTQSQRAIDADAARWTGLAEYYQSRGVGLVVPGTGVPAGATGSGELTRGQEADADRYEGLADHHLGR